MSLIPSAIPVEVGGSGSGSFVPSDVSFQVAIGGIPFTTAISADNPYIRESVPVEKRQFDSGELSGERSLGDWWRRSQASFHGGAGLKYAEPDGPKNETDPVRFFASRKLDVWTPGQVTPLPDTTQLMAVGSTMSGLATATVGATNYTLVTFSTTLRVHNGTSTTDYTWGGAGTILSLCTDGTNYYVVDSTGIYKGPVDNGSNGVKIYNQTGSPSTRVVLAWVKQRLMVAYNAAIYELVAAGLALPAVKYTHPNASWTWTSFAEGPASIMVSGFAGIESCIQEFTLATDGSSPVLVSGQTTPLPPGEVAYSLHSSTNSFLGIGTSKGLRIGQFDLNATLVLGPLTFTTTAGVLGISSRANYLYAGATAFVDGESCLVRADLGQPTDKAGRFAYASDLVCPTLQTGSNAFVRHRGDGRMVFAVQGYGVILEGVGPGIFGIAWLQTARVRVGTIESKLFRTLWIRGSFPDPSSVAVIATTSDGQTTNPLPTTSSPTDIEEVGLITAPQEWISLKFNFQGSAVDFRGYVIKALSATRPRRLFQIPLALADEVVDRHNVHFGSPGYGLTRLLQLEAIENGRDEVRFEIFTPTGTLAEQCTIEQLSYRQVHQPGQTGAFGGILIVTLKTVI